MKLIDYIIRSHFIDFGKPDDLIILAGMGRSGTTWAGNIINNDQTYRILFEPFLPYKVKEAKEFNYIQHLTPHSSNPILAKKAKLILAGKIRNNWVDRDNTRLFYGRRIVKDIRCNLMLGWLKHLSAEVPIVLMIRHPLQIVSSWSKLGWGNGWLGKGCDLDIIMSQKSLLDEFPIINDVMKQIDPHDFVENVVFQWCIYHLVPSYHLKNSEAYALFYENMLINPDREVVSLFRYLNRSFNKQRVQRILKKSSSTNFLKRDFNKDKSHLLNNWKSEFSTQQVQRADSIISAFALDDIYDKNGYPTGAPVFRY